MDEKLDKAEELGAVDTVNAREVDDAAAEVHDITNGARTFRPMRWVLQPPAGTR